jgi:DNA primase
VVLLFDGDAAGRKAARAAEEPCDKAGLRAQVGILPDRTDPDEFVRTKGEPALRHLLGQARGLVDYLIDMELDESFHAADARERSERIERVTAILGRQRDPITREMLKEVADRAASRLDLVRSAPGAYQALVRKVMASARMAEGPSGPRPTEARVRQRPPGQEERKAIVGALLDFPALADEADVREVLTLLSGESARIVSALRACTRTRAGGEKALDGAEFLAQMPPVIQAFASARLAAPAHENIEEARATVIANAKKLRETSVAQEAREIVHEQRRDAGNWDAELERAKHVAALVRQRQGMDSK